MEQGFQVIFQPSGRRGFVPAGKTILDAARQLGVEIEAICGEKRTCGKCKVKVQEGFFERYGIESKIDNTSLFHAVEANFINRDECNMCRLSCYAEI
ncbi:MAG: 2Fe-2S iron-sulfur cluster binding domain-containing protein, partial [Chloroflexi bacterium]|nr:2Fe-2S iron-sulfur cluster binding domain-containing protein [Chloroflexota bacterium]